jgi:hypothetical protein
MAYKTKDGKNYESGEMGRAHDRGSSSMAPKEKMGEPDGDEQPIHEVVAEHGPADETKISKEGDEYQVESHHGGHTHHSKGHKSAHDAHNHSLEAMGEEPMQGAGAGTEGSGAMPMPSGGMMGGRM